MCCLFGVLDYGGYLSHKNKNILLSVLSTECEERGVDATGIAYNTNGRLAIYKRPLPAHRLIYDVPCNTRFITGHTRLTTQGSEKRNYNNHPFLGCNQSGNFALCHNGVLHNDVQLRNSEKLPQTKIQTDSYIAVQLLERQSAIDFNSLKHMAEQVEGSYTFTVLDGNNNLYVVRGNNPFCLYHFPRQKVYLYASTENILTRAIMKLGIKHWAKESIPLSCGDILRVDCHGKLRRERFILNDSSNFMGRSSYRRFGFRLKSTEDNEYINELKSFAPYFGCTPELIDELSAEGFSADEIEEILYTNDCQQYFLQMEGEV